MPKTQDRIAIGLRVRLRADSLLRVHHVASITGLSCRTVRHLAKTGQLYGTKMGQRIWIFRGSAVGEFLTRRRCCQLDYDGGPCSAFSWLCG